jgi:hypothetical protein
MEENKFNIPIRSLDDFIYNPYYKLVGDEEFFKDIIYNHNGTCRIIGFRRFGINLHIIKR